MESFKENPQDSKDIEVHIKSVNEYFYSDKTDLYFKEVPIIEAKILSGEINYSSKVEFCNSLEILNYYKSLPVIQQVYDDIALYQKCMNLEEHIKSTEADSDYYGIKTWFKYEESDFI